jgi:hypothetical protein
MERMLSNAIIQCFFTILVNVMKGELEWIQVCTGPISFLNLSQKCRRCIPRGVPPIYSQMCWKFMSRASLVDVGSGRPRVRGFVSCRRQKYCLFLQNFQTCLELHTVPYPVGIDFCSPGAEWSRREAERSPLYRVEVKNGWISTSIPSGVFVLWL